MSVSHSKEPIDRAFAESRDGTLRLPDDYIYLHDATAKYIARKLKQRPDITRVDLHSHESEGQITDRGAKALAEVQTLASLDLSNHRITDEGARALAKHTHLKTLNLGYNPELTDASARAFADNRTLESLDLSDNKITDEGAKALASNTTLQQLRLDYNDITDEGARAFLHNKSLTSLEIGENEGIGDVAFAEIERQIARNRDRSVRAGR